MYISVYMYSCFFGMWNYRQNMITTKFEGLKIQVYLFAMGAIPFYRVSETCGPSQVREDLTDLADGLNGSINNRLNGSIKSVS